MKRTLLAAAILVAMAMFNSCGQKQDSDLSTTPPSVKLYGIENARVEYAYSGAASGTKTTIIANWGMYQRMEDNFSFNMDGQARNLHSIDITSDSTVYALDMIEKKGTKSIFDFDGFGTFTDDFKPEEKEDFQGSYILRTGGSKSGKETILDHECDVYQLPYMGMKIWLWKGLTLKSTMIMGADTMTITATNIDVDYTATTADFLPPSEIKVVDLTQGMPAGHPPVDEGAGSELPEGHPKMAPMRMGGDEQK